jgi:hypothetical protein
MAAKVVPRLLTVEVVTDWGMNSPFLLSIPSNFCDDRYFHQLYATLVLVIINFYILS